MHYTRKAMKNRICVYLLLCTVFSIYQAAGQESTPVPSFSGLSDMEKILAEKTTDLMQHFLVSEDIAAIEEMLHDSAQLTWPNQSKIDRSTLLQVCSGLAASHENEIKFIDMAVQGNTSFILFVWSGTITNHEIPSRIGQEFSTHDCWRLRWEDGKIIEWYPIWGSEQYARQIGFDLVLKEP